MIIIYKGAQQTLATSWDHARRQFLAAVEADEDCQVWDTDPDSRTGMELWKFDSAARQAKMRKEIPA